MVTNSFRNCDKIRRKRDYLAIYQQGTRSYSDNFAIILLHRHSSGLRRIGITVSKKVGNAVRRNRIKRLIREFFRLNKLRLPESQDIVIVGKNCVPRLSYRDVCRELECLVNNKVNE